MTVLVAASLVLGPLEEDASLADADARFYVGWPSDAGHGARVRGLGDMDGDGVGDFAIACEREGAVYLYYGGREGTQQLADADVRFAHGTYYAVGSALDGVGDVDDDGFDDLLLGSVNYSEGRGMAALIPGWAP